MIYYDLLGFLKHLYVSSDVEATYVFWTASDLSHMQREVYFILIFCFVCVKGARAE